ncbi:alpha-N-acetylgalactosaminide alpha-2,6-sialyltransferase 5 isoform X1 [Syngnathus scovelli]|uniref:alpha-N-acetylgalactosaminide alpha-2,6-sialyltransferase 5 isoform X1 n=1 Tax=Syngnathus scovelli TaxID=161590 RepID=UPI00210FC043|nr:alpha-N-acetylgalactosaminide alpha-2,6-sialyltransferase 5 isoform X1 [Syngnathus scovelli]
MALFKRDRCCAVVALDPGTAYDEWKGVGSIIVVTMVTSLMVAYNRRSSGDRSSSPQSLASSSQHKEGAMSAMRKRPRMVSTLGGYTGVMDRKTLKMHCGTCALITSSGHLTGGERGPEIDRADCVIRMNDAPSVGYERDVSRRTTLRVVAHSSLQRVLRKQRELLNATQGTVFVFWGPSNCMKRDGRGHVFNHLKILNQQLPSLKLYIISRLQMMAFDELFKNETGIDRKSSNTWLSTGWFTMAMALELCDRINVYGMVPPDHCRSPSSPSVPYHYYEPSGPAECTMYLSHERSRRGSHHRFITEKMVFANWAQSLDIHFYQPDWKPVKVSSAIQTGS